MSFSRIIESLTPSATLSITKRVRELKEAGEDVIGLTLGEPDFDTPKHIRDAAKWAIDKGYTHYPPVSGVPELRQAIAEKLQNENGLAYKKENVIVSTGAKQSIYNIIMALTNPGDEIVIPAPYWVSYYGIAELAQVNVRQIVSGIEQEYKMVPEDLDAAITENTKLMIFSSPCNPSGSVYSREEFEAIAAVLARHPHVYIIADEIYEQIVYDRPHISLGTFPAIADRVITVNGMSKGFAMTGWRVGYMAAPRPLAVLCENLQGQCTSGANSIAQMAALAALTSDLSPTYQMRDAFRERRDFAFERLKAIDGIKVLKPEGAFYFYPDLSHFFGKKDASGNTISDINALCLYLIEKGGVALVPGSAFGTPNEARISYAYSKDMLEEALNRMENALGKLED